MPSSNSQSSGAMQSYSRLSSMIPSDQSPFHESQLKRLSDSDQAIAENNNRSGAININNESSEKRWSSFQDMCVQEEIKEEIKEEDKEEDENSPVSDIHRQQRKFQSMWRAWELEKLNKSRRERRQEKTMWVQRLQNNLTKINGDIERQGEQIQELFKSEREAR